MSFAILWSGQGAQHPDLFQHQPFTGKGRAIRERVEQAGVLPVAAQQWLQDPAQNPEAIFQNRLSQPLLCLYQAMVWAELDLPRPRLLAGLSLGELSACLGAGFFSSEEMVRLAGERAECMEAVQPGGRLVVQVGVPWGEAESVAAGCVGEVHTAIVFSENHSVLGCRPEAVTGLVNALRGHGSTLAEPLAVSVPSHTAFLDDAVVSFAQSLQRARWERALVPVLTGVETIKATTESEMNAALLANIHRTIRWDRILTRLSENGIQVVLEIGPGCQLAHMVLAAYPQMQARSVEEFRSWEGVGTWVRRALERLG